MAEQKKPSAFDGVTGKTTPGARGPAQSPVSPVTEALYQPREYDKQQEVVRRKPESWNTNADMLYALGVYGTGPGDNAMYRFDTSRVWKDGLKLHSAYEAAGLPPGALPYHNIVDLALAEQAKEKLAKGQVAPEYEGMVRQIAEYIPYVYNQEHADLAKKAGLPVQLLPKPPAHDPYVSMIHDAADESAPRRNYEQRKREATESRLPATQRSLQRIAEATPPTKKK